MPEFDRLFEMLGPVSRAACEPVFGHFELTESMRAIVHTLGGLALDEQPLNRGQWKDLWKSFVVGSEADVNPRELLVVIKRDLAISASAR